MSRSTPLALCLAVGCASPSDAEDRDGETHDTAEAPPPATDASSPSLPTRVDLGPEVRCGAPEARSTLGAYAAPEVGGYTSPAPARPPRTLFVGGGAAVVDLDGDGALDLVFTDRGQVGLWRASPAGFVALPVPPSDLVAAVIPADLEGDGDTDLFVARWGAPDLLWRNEAGVFTDVAQQAGVAGPSDGRSATASWADFDRDGDLDLFVGTHGGLTALDGAPSGGSRLYRSQGDGTFVDASALLPIEAAEAHAFVGGWHDLDADGWLDLYIVSDFGQHRPNQLLWNRQGTLVPDDDAVGLDVRLQGMGLGVGDLDGDGQDDVVVAGWSNNRVLLQRDRSWYDAHATLGVLPSRDRGQSIGWATELADLDNDGDLDIVEGYGAITGQRGEAEQPDEIFRNDGARFTPVGEAWGFAAPDQTRAIVAVDLDRDGWIDLVRASLSGPPTVQRARCGAAAWTIVQLEQAGANPAAIGARVTVETEGVPQHRSVVAGSTSVLASGPPEVHIGLGGAERVHTLTVRWPDGAVSVLHDLPTRRTIRVTREPG